MAVFISYLVITFQPWNEGRGEFEGLTRDVLLVNSLMVGFPVTISVDELRIDGSEPSRGSCFRTEGENNQRLVHATAVRKAWWAQPTLTPRLHPLVLRSPSLRRLETKSSGSG